MSKSNNMKYAALLLIFLFVAPTFSHAQKLVERRDQASGWYVPVKFRVTAEGGDAKKVDVKIYKDNALIHEIIRAKSKFTVNLDLDNTYTIVMSKDGYRTKSIFMDTHVPDQQVQYSAYQCTMNLEAADKFKHSDPFYLDFPGAIVRWSDKEAGFLPQLAYLSDIQSKVAMLQAQMSPQ